MTGILNRGNPINPSNPGSNYYFLNSQFKIHNSKFYTGFQVVGSQLRPLPVGSTLDMERGVFYWKPGPGFICVYEFVFIQKGGASESKRKIIRVIIRPKFLKE